MEKVTYN